MLLEGVGFWLLELFLNDLLVMCGLFLVLVEVLLSLYVFNELVVVDDGCMILL